MKFARYLEDTQTPEWQRAYINYRLLKKRITAIRRANGEQSKTDSDPISTAVPAGTSQPSVLQVIDSQSSLHHSISSNPQKNPPKSETATASVSNLVHSNASGADQSHRREPFNRSYTAPPQGSIHSDWSIRGRPTSLSRMFSSGNSKGTGRLFTVGPKPHPYSELPLRELIPLLSPPELAFFSTLDAELDKIETFYIARQGEMHLRTKLLEDQLDELAEHRRLFHVHHNHITSIFS
ncbi:SPX domain-containing protein [Mycena belliarum]|uniref:SPX domain-containing protein n=1 Tax=Mycena belliarum TaxID=1033014 RepID=A0AAD6Y036_9AGAR|nr:SPX domain-containing protein [Mycena belliae]